MKTLHLEIVTAESPVFSDDVDIVIAPGIVGQLGILPNHDALMTMIEPGELCVRKGAEETFIVVSGGFLEVLDNKVIILADAAEHADQIDLERAEAAKQRAQERLEQHPVEMDLGRAEAALRRSLARLKVAQRRRRGGKTGPPHI
ncbi:F0F1 ATP synthase subunit epsilon [Chloroflexota bacterium]